MATEESVTNTILVDVVATEKRISFWASSVDAFLQDFLEKAKANDKLGSLVASARMAQLGGSLCQEFKGMVESLVESATEMKVAQQACGAVAEMVNRNGEQCGLLKEDAPVATPTPDRSFN